MPQPPEVTVAITDDHQVVIEGLSAALRSFPHIRILDTATSADSMLRFLRVRVPDVLITDVMMPGTDGEALARTVRELYPQVRLVALTMNNSGEQIERLAPYIDAYLLKQCSIRELAGAVDAVHAGGTYFSPVVTEERVRYRRSRQHIREAGITPRETEVIRLLKSGLASKEIASALSISVRTVETHRKNILRKTDTTNVLALLRWTEENRLLV